VIVSEIATVGATGVLTEAVFRDAAGYFSRLRITVTGGCMRPELEPGDVVLLAPASLRPPRFGDVVLALFPNGPRLHRLVWRPVGGAWRTMADGSREIDPPLRRQDVLGTVIGVEGRPARTLRRRARAAASLLGAVRAWLARPSA
jgi:hypothetical protein